MSELEMYSFWLEFALSFVKIGSLLSAAVWANNGSTGAKCIPAEEK